MAELKGTNVAAGIVPFTSEDKYATHDAQYGKGGFRSVATIAERDAIPAERKTEGMIVRVTANGLNYEWKNNAWVEWLPKGNVTVDATLSTTSNNAVANKAVTAGINEAKAAAATAKTVADAAIPKTSILQSITQPAATDKVPSAKAALDFMTNISDGLTTQITSVRNTANAAIPKANIAQDIEANKAREDLVPSTKAVADAIDGKIADIPKPTIDNALSTTSTNAVQNKVVTAAINDHASRISDVEAETTSLRSDLGNVESDVTTNHNAITDINSKLTPIKTAWDKKNAANGIVVLDGAAKLPASVLPAGYDNIDMLVAFVTANPTTGMKIGQKWYNTTTKKIFTATSATSGSETTPDGNEKVYINVATNKSYRWTGSDMVVIGDGSGVALGTTSSTAFPGDKGNELYKYMNDNIPPQYGNGTFKRKDALGQAADFFHRIDSVTNTPFILCANDPESEPVVDTTATDVTVQVGTFVGGSEGSCDQTSSAFFTLDPANANKAGVMTAAMYKTLQELELQAFPLQVSAGIGGAGVYEAGSKTRDVISIRVERKGVQVNSGATIEVTSGGGSSVDGSLNAAKTVWAPNVDVTTYSQKVIKVTYGAQSKTVNVAWNFKYKKYWGVSDKATLTNAEMLALAGSGWADARTMGATRFDCTGGKYPYYIIPADKYTGLEVWVGGLKNTDLVVTDVNLVNASGATKAYKVVRLANKQTGILSIEFK